MRVAEGLRRFDLAEHASLKGNEKPDGVIAVDITVGQPDGLLIPSSAAAGRVH